MNDTKLGELEAKKVASTITPKEEVLRLAYLELRTKSNASPVVKSELDKAQEAVNKAQADL